MRAHRKTWRNLHIAAAAYNFLFIYTPLHAVPFAFSIVQWAAYPLLTLTGLMMGKNYLRNRKIRRGRQAKPGFAHA